MARHDISHATLTGAGEGFGTDFHRGAGCDSYWLFGSILYEYCRKMGFKDIDGTVKCGS